MAGEGVNKIHKYCPEFKMEPSIFRSWQRFYNRCRKYFGSNISEILLQKNFAIISYEEFIDVLMKR